MKTFFQKFLNTYLFWITASAGVLLMLYGIWFQTEGLTMTEVPLLEILASIAVGVLLAFVIMKYLISLTKEKKTNPGRGRASRKDLMKMVYGYVACTYICVLMQYTATSVSIFLISIAGISLSFTSIWTFLIWDLSEQKKKKAEHEH